MFKFHKISQFDENDNKLYAIPGNDDDAVNAAQLEGEQAPIEVPPEWQPQLTSSTPQMSPKVKPTPDPPAQAPAQQSARITQRPDYWKINDPGHADSAYVTHEIVTEPENYQAAVSHDNAPIWEEIMQIEMDQHQEIRTWEMTELPPGRTAISC
jgi:hypothetical protein